jgi:Methyltransferase domain
MPTLGDVLRGAADDNETGSLSHRLRERRFAAFETAASVLERPMRLLDVGGTVDFWEARGWAGRDDVEITLLNLIVEPSPYENIVSTAGDAADLSEYESGAFDLVFSNSVIEHVGTPDRQAAMAREIARVSTAYWVQTPNYWFPMEPHYLVPAWQWLPESARVAILRRRRVGQLGRTPDPREALEVVRGTRLLSRSALARMFPDAALVPERFGGLVKSWTAVAGLPAPASL